MNGTHEEATSFANRLNLLFETIRPAGRESPHSNKDVAAAIRAAGGSISDVYIWQLRTGRRTNPTKEHIEALAQFFGVSPAYFFDEEQARHTIADLRTLDALRRLQVQHLSLRTVLQHKGLSPASQDVIQQMVDRCLELEGLTVRDGSAPATGPGPTPPDDTRPDGHAEDAPPPDGHAEAEPGIRGTQDGQR